MNRIKEFAASARALAKNPLGIIALFILLIYGFASLVLTVGGGSLQTASERLPIVWFLAVFPVLVLIVFGWLVAYHHLKLYGPSDYTSEKSFLMTSGIGVTPPEDIEKGRSEVATSDQEVFEVAPDATSVLEEEYSMLVNTGYSLLHAVDVIRERTRAKTGRYRIRVWVEDIEGRPLSDIESVTYRVWDDFPQTTFVSKSQRTQFDLWLHVYGEFPILAYVQLKDGGSIMLQRYLDIPGRPPD